MERKQLFAVPIKAPNDRLDLSMQPHLPSELLETLQQEKEAIERGDYDLCRWDIELQNGGENK